MYVVVKLVSGDEFLAEEVSGVKDDHLYLYKNCTKLGQVATAGKVTLSFMEFPMMAEAGQTIAIRKTNVMFTCAIESGLEGKFREYLSGIVLPSSQKLVV